MLKALRSPLLALALIVAFAGTVLATGASHFGPPTLLSRGTLSGPMHVNTGAVKFQTKESTDFVTQTITFGAPGSSGWHAHKGIALVTVASGSLVHYDADCAATTYAAGSSFVESGTDVAALVRNESTTTPAVVYVTWIVPAGTTALRIDMDNPGCSQS
ncbi:MAG: hypothetical protein H0V73_05805 [Chloroflexi bacterium]|nr:hypothetical protein [Chloroflexota bacterium]